MRATPRSFGSRRMVCSSVPYLRLVQVLRPCQQVASSDKAGKGTLYALRKGVHWYIGELQGQDPCACRNTTAGAVC